MATWKLGGGVASLGERETLLNKNRRREREGGEYNIIYTQSTVNHRFLFCLVALAGQDFWGEK